MVAHAVEPSSLIAPVSSAVEGRRQARIAVPVWILVAASLFVLLGSVIRFANLERKGYTNDEATTSLHVSGHTVEEYARDVVDGRVRTVGELRRFQYVDRGTTAADVVRGLAHEDPQHPPLYYLFERSWLDVFGDTIGAKRSMSALFGVMALAATAWFGFELFGALAPALVAAALLAVSPFHVVYAQQAREYALWTLLTAIACALVLGAIRKRSSWLWVLYCGVLVLALYTDPLFLFVLAAHVAYVLSLKSTRRAATLVPFSLATAAALALYGPWLALLFAGAHAGTVTNNSYLASALPPVLFAMKWIFNVGSLFYDLDYRWPYTAVLLLPIFAALAVAFVTILRSAAPRTSIFLMLLIGVPVCALVIPDLLHHETRSTSSRYFVPAWLGVELLLAWFIARAAQSVVSWQRALALNGACAYLALGAVSCAVGTFETTWWADGSAVHLRAMATIIAGADRPLVVYHSTWTHGRSEPSLWDFIVPQLIDELPTTVRVQQLRRDGAVRIDDTAGTTFLVDPTDAFRARLAALGAVLVPLNLDASEQAGPFRSLRSKAAEARGRSYTEAQQTLWRFERLPKTVALSVP